MWQATDESAHSYSQNQARRFKNPQYSGISFVGAYVTTCHSQNTYIRNGKETSFEAQRTVTNQTASNPREEKQTT